MDPVTLNTPTRHGLKKGDAVWLRDEIHYVAKVSDSTTMFIMVGWAYRDRQFERFMFWLAGAALLFWLYIGTWHVW